MEFCDNSNGRCHCRENVVGERCDACASDHYGFQSCEGCKRCECGAASERTQCDLETGQCACKPGVTGRKCDQCIPGYWNYGSEGCTSCGCNTGYSVGVSCNTGTGQCTCLPGVIGEKCDHCPYRHVFIEAQGCFSCGSCTGDLLDLTDQLSELLDPIAREYSSVAESYFTNQRLKFINDTANHLDPEVKLLDPGRVNFSPLQQELAQLEQIVEGQRRQVAYTTEDSIKWKLGAANTLDEMDHLERDVAREIQLVNDIVSEVRVLAGNIEVGGAGRRVESALAEAREILDWIKELSFIGFRDRATDQADQANILVSEMLDYNVPVANLTATGQQLGERMHNTSEKLEQLRLSAERASKLAASVERLNRENRAAAEAGNFDTVRNATLEAREDFFAGEQLNGNASDHLAAAVTNVSVLRASIVQAVAEATGGLNATIAHDDQSLLELGGPVQKAREHAENLDSRSLDLDGLLADTRNTTAVRAVSAYRDIEEGIQAARGASAGALAAARNATILSDGMEERMLAGRDECFQLLGAAEAALEKTNGKPEKDIAAARGEGRAIESQNMRNRELLDYIDKSLGNMPSHSSSQLAEEATNPAVQVEASIRQAVANMNASLMETRIPEDLREVRHLSKESSDAVRDVSQAKKQLDMVDKVLPNITQLLADLAGNQREIEFAGAQLQEKIAALRGKVVNARELSDRFRTGLRFYRNTTLELNNPESLPLLATSTKLSLYFRTNQSNGLLLYLGNEDGSAKAPTRSKSQDFLALLVESGYPVLIVDFGSGPEKVINTKFVSDNIWRQILVDRTGKNVKLTVREDAGEGKDRLYTKTQLLSGSYSIFNVDRAHSKLFVGGYPSSFQIQKAVTASSFEGEMEELVIGDLPVSFWNFVDGENNRDFAMERDKLINFQPSTGFRFDRHGYAILSKKDFQISPDAKKFSIKLNFKTFVEDGLIYLMGKGRQFLSLEMKAGQVLYQYDLGDGGITLRSSYKYNDGRWHNLEALRFEKMGVLKLDGTDVVNNKVQGTTKTLLSSDRIYFGGYPPSAEHPYRTVTNDGFEGCIDDVVILDTVVDLTRNIQAFGVVPGCPARFASLVSFEENGSGYVKWHNVSAANTLQVNLKFRTLANNGLIFHLTDAGRGANSYLSLLNGLLLFHSQGEELRTSDLSGIKFNDNEWHVITATHGPDSLRLDVDDTKIYSTDSSLSPPTLDIISGSLYIGGVPPSHTGIAQSAAATPFVGCIGDATVNGVIINFANTTERPRAYLGKCQAADSSPLPPIVELEPDLLPPILPPEGTDEVAEVSTQINVVDVELDKENGEEEQPTLEGRLGYHGDGETTTAVEATTATLLHTTLPISIEQCRLPYYPAVDPDLENAWRFGTARNSRLEYRSLNGRYRNDYDFQIDVKTMADDGIIFYTADHSTKNRDLIAVYVSSGKIHYKFDCGSGPALLVSDKKINDNQWHIVIFKRQGNYGEVIVDEEPAVGGYSQGDTQTINVNPPFYVGGVLPEISTIVDMNIGLNHTFSGCLGNFMMNGQLVGDPTDLVGVIPCSKRIEPGLFFFPGNGSNLFKAVDKFTVGRTVDIQMDIKPRATSGHLLSVHGKRDYLVLEMVNGTVKFLVKTAKGSIETAFVPTNPSSLCDGNWHNIRAVKQKNAVLLSVDHIAAPPGIGGKNVAGVLSKHPIFIGGHPMLGRRLRGSTSQAQYVGCIANIHINMKPINLGPERAYGQVLSGVCPTI